MPAVAVGAIILLVIIVMGAGAFGAGYYYYRGKPLPAWLPAGSAERKATVGGDAAPPTAFTWVVFPDTWQEGVFYNLDPISDGVESLRALCQDDEMFAGFNYDPATRAAFLVVAPQSRRTGMRQLHRWEARPGSELHWMEQVPLAAAAPASIPDDWRVTLAPPACVGYSPQRAEDARAALWAALAAGRDSVSVTRMAGGWLKFSAESVPEPNLNLMRYESRVVAERATVIPRCTLSQVNEIEEYRAVSAGYPTPEAPVAAAAVFGDDGLVLWVFETTRAVRFDLLARRHTAADPRPGGLVGYGVARAGDRLLAAGGFTFGAPVADVHYFDPRTGAWSRGPSLPEALYDVALAAAADGTVYAVGGRGAGDTASLAVRALAPGAAAWRQVATLPATPAGDRSAAVADMAGAPALYCGAGTGGYNYGTGGMAGGTGGTAAVFGLPGGDLKVEGLPFGGYFPLGSRLVGAGGGLYLLGGTTGQPDDPWAQALSPAGAWVPVASSRQVAPPQGRWAAAGTPGGQLFVVEYGRLQIITP